MKNKSTKTNINKKLTLSSFKITQNFGFTLIELLVVIVIIGILASISIATFNNYKDRAYDSVVKSAISQLYKQTIVNLYKSEDLKGYDEINPYAIAHEVGINKTKKGKLDYIASKENFIYVGTLFRTKSEDLWSFLVDTAYANEIIDNKFFVTGTAKAISDFKKISNKPQLVKSIKGNSQNNDVSSMGADYTYAVNVWNNANNSVSTNREGYSAGEIVLA